MRFEFYDFFMSKRSFIALKSVGLNGLFMNCLHMSPEAALIYEFFPDKLYTSQRSLWTVNLEREREGIGTQKRKLKLRKGNEISEVFQSSEFQVKAKSKCKNFNVGQTVCYIESEWASFLFTFATESYCSANSSWGNTTRRLLCKQHIDLYAQRFFYFLFV